MKLFSFFGHARTLLLAAAAFLPVLSCNKEVPVADVKPEVSLEVLTVGDTSVEFSVTTKDADYFTWSIAGEGVEEREVKVEDSQFETTISDLLPNTPYSISVTAWNGELSSEASETFTTSVTPAVTIGAVTPTHNSVSFVLTPSYATALYWAVKETGTEVGEADWQKVENPGSEAVELTASELLPETSYTISAYAVNGDKAGETVEQEFTTAAVPSANDYISVSYNVGAHGIYIEVTCGEMDGKKYYANLFSPVYSEGYDYDTGECYLIDSKESFLKYVNSNAYYLSWSDLYGDTSTSAWMSSAYSCSIEPDSDYLIYAVTFVEDGDNLVLDEDGVIEVKVHTAAADVIGEGNATMDFTVTAGSDEAEIVFSDYDNVVAYASGYATADEVEAAGGIEAYVEAEFNDYMYFNTMDYFSSSTQIRSLMPSTDYWYYTLCYGKDAKLGALTAKEFTTEGLEYSPDYTCTIEILGMSGTEASFTIHSDNCSEGRWYNMTADEFESVYGSDIDKVVAAELSSYYADQVFTDGRAYIYDLEAGKEYVLVVIPMGGDMSTEYGTPVMERFTFDPAE